MRQGDGTAVRRRAAGIVLLCVAVLAIAALGRLQNPPRLAGTAAAEPPAPPPSVGDCLLALPVDDGWYEPGVLPPPLQLGDCTEPHFGEVYTVVPYDTADDGPSCWGDDSAVPDPLSYLGQPPTPAGSWFPTLNFFVVLGGPDERQRDTGQAWVACVIALSTYADSRPFTAPLAGAYAAGTLPVQFAVCQDGADLTRSSSVPCDRPHIGEDFAQIQLTGPGPDADTLTAGCTELVARMAGTDPAGWESLEVRVVAYLLPDGSGPDVVVPPLRTGQNGHATCGVVATDGRRLAGSLLALGDAPVPWAR
ncbi:hypothetical protein [Nakamurella deserti]|uniref:hypothetical protein n=1 Tax=Nakamurella deserti TaxID=2164074 RepID=UPI0013005E6C|nr:hypothetical protein [Nakamurella deserti]